MKYIKNEQGFSPIELTLVIVVIILIGVIGFLVYRESAKTAKTNYVAPHSTAVSSSASPAVNKPSPYSGWKSVCSTSGALCLKYPASWIVSRNTQGPKIITITSPSGKTAIKYWPSGVISSTGNNEQVSIETVTQSNIPGLEVVSQLDEGSSTTAPNFLADIFLRASNSTTPGGRTLSPGITYINSYEPLTYTFQYPSGNAYAQSMYVEDLSTNGDGSNFFSSQLAAQAWLNSPEVKTAAQIMSSATAK